MHLNTPTWTVLAFISFGAAFAGICVVPCSVSNRSCSDGGVLVDAPGASSCNAAKGLYRKVVMMLVVYR